MNINLPSQLSLDLQKTWVYDLGYQAVFEIKRKGERVWGKGKPRSDEVYLEEWEQERPGRGKEEDTPL